MPRAFQSSFGPVVTVCRPFIKLTFTFPSSPPFTKTNSRSKCYPHPRHRQLHYRPAGVGGRHSSGTHSVHRRDTLCARGMGGSSAGRAERQERRLCIGQEVLSVRGEARHLLTADTLNPGAVEWRSSRWHLPIDDHFAEPLRHRLPRALFLFSVPEHGGVDAPQELLK